MKIDSKAVGAPLYATFALLILCSPAAWPAVTCESLQSARVPSATITATQSITGGTFTPPTGAPITNLPPFCRVALTMAPSADSNIRVEVWLPTEDWTGRYQGTGGGGYTGAIGYGALAAGLRLGNAVANTDMGTAPATGGNGVALVGHPEKWLDFGSRSTHLMTVAGKTLVRAFYGRGPEYSYFTGCSTGGHQGLAEAQVFPDDYDGILAGAPGHNRTHLHTAFVWNYAIPRKAPGALIPAAKLTLLNNAVRAACVGKDGGLATDTFLTNPAKCQFDLAAVACSGADAPTCLTASELHTARKFYDGPRNPRTGDLIYPGWPLGTETGWSGRQGTTSPSFEGITAWALGADYNPLGVDFDSHMATVDSVVGPSVNFLSTDLSRFRARNGKLLMYHGTADSTVVSQDTINYYERMMSDERLGLGDLQSFARLYMVPGMGHCSGGNGPNVFDALSALIQWVEQGQPPEQIVATKFVNNNQTLGIEMTRPLCPYPQEPRYTGAGDTKSATSFACLDDGNRIAAELPGREYLAPLLIEANAPNSLNLRTSGGTVTIVLRIAHGSDTFLQWVPSNVRAEGAAAISGELSADGKTYVVKFNRSDLQGFDGGGQHGEHVDLMITGSLRHNGLNGLFATSATVTVNTGH